MFSKVWAIIQIIKALWSFFRSFRDWQIEEKAKEAERRRLEREQALKDLENAQTEEEFDDAQDRVVGLKPTP